MLIRPDNLNDYGVICGIDPGTNHLGFAVLNYSIMDGSITAISAWTVNSNHLHTSNDIIIDTHGERIYKLIKQKENLLRLFKLHMPNLICCESPFFNRLSPMAYGALTEVVMCIHTAAIEYSPDIPFLTYEPSTIKKAVGAGAIVDKHKVKIAMQLIPELQCVDLNLIDEHAIDAIAVCYTALVKLRTFN